jgi:hypothetical protein
MLKYQFGVRVPALSFSPALVGTYRTLYPGTPFIED